jgi:hypothetical protein
MEDWSVRKDTEANAAEMKRIARSVGGRIETLRGGALCVPVLRDGEGDDGTPGDDAEAEASLSSKAALSTLSLGELIELSGGHVLNCGPLNALCERHEAYQVWTREYVERLGDYLAERCRALQQREKKHRSGEEYDDDDDDDNKYGNYDSVVILDVGAGDGLLVQLLREYLGIERSGSGSSPDINLTARAGRSSRVSNEMRRRSLRLPGPNHTERPSRRRNKLAPRRPVPSSSPAANRYQDDNGTRGTSNSTDRPVLVATDDGSWSIFPRAPVERLSVEQALERYAPVLPPAPSTPSPSAQADSNHGGRVTIVLCSWMPMDVDWTRLFRRHRVDEYVLIGERDDGQCGHNWETWGNPHFFEDEAIDDGGGGASVDESSAGPPPTAAAAPARQPQRPHPPPSRTPPYVVDGYDRVDLDFLASHQFSRYDSRVSKSGGTVSFRRR